MKEEKQHAEPFAQGMISSSVAMTLDESFVIPNLEKIFGRN